VTGEARASDGVTDRTRRLVFELPAKPAAVSAARRALLGCNGELPSSIRDDVLLLVTELVSNAVRHAAPGADRAVRVELRRRRRMLRVAVFDGGGGFTAEAPHATRDESGGWGLFLVDQIADRWAVTPTASGTCAWFEIRCEQ
jgi:anti-sigma regulatory factor (Ser/Thr protein kinase)